MNSGIIERVRRGRGLSQRFERLKRIVILGAAAAVAVQQVGCVKDAGYDPGKDSGADEVEVMIMMNVPAVAVTRAMTAADENRIDHLDVLVFLDNGPSVPETFLYKTHATDYVPNADGSTSAVKVGFRKSRTGEAHRFVFIANLKEEIAALQDTWTGTMTKAEVLATITFDAYPANASTPAARAWDTATPRYLPMWGETEGTHVVTSSLLGSALRTIRMLRAVATVDIVLNPDVSSAGQGFGTDFVLKEIKAYNVPQKGFAAPDPDFYTAGLPTYSTAFSRNASTVVGYTADPALDEDKYGVTHLIYIPEAPNTDGNIPTAANIDDLEQTCLVISGSYKGGAPTWYRLDFIDKLTSTENLRYDILRNHRYTFYITAVGGPGYDDEETAFKSGPMNLDTEIIVWNDDGKMNDIEFDGQYHLSVNTDSLYFYQDGREQVLHVTTNHPGGWEIAYTPETEGWVTATPGAAPAGWAPDETSEVAISCEAITSSIQPNRAGYIIIKAGKLRKMIKIYQANEPELTLEIDEQYLYFNKSAGQPKSIRVTTYPDGIPIYFSEVDGDISWRSGGHPDATEYGGSGLYTFHPAAITSDPAVQRTSSFSVMVKQGTKRVTKIVEIIQKAVDLVFDWTPKNAFVPEAGQRTITVTSDTDWYVDGTDGTTEMFATQPVSSLNPPGESGYVLDLAGNDTWQPRSARLSVKSNDLDFPGDYITISQSAKAPVISIDKSGEIDISNANVTVAVTSNAQWTFSGDSYFDDTATSAPYGSSADSPLSTVTQGGVTFIKKNWTAANGTPAAGTKYTSTVTFTTTATGLPSGVNQAATNFKVSSTVPGFWTAASTPFSPANNANIPSADNTTVTVKANTNARWTVTPSAGSAQSLAAQPYGEKAINVTIPAYNNGWGNRTVTMQVSNDANGTSSSATYNQKGYYISASGHSAPTSIAAAGGNQTVSVNGWYPGGRVKVRASGAVTVEGTVTGSAGSITGAGNASATVNPGANNNWSARSIQFQYCYSTDGSTWTNWTNIGGAVNQPAAYSNSTPTLNSSTIAGGGQTIRVTVAGTYPDNWIEVQATGTQVSVSGTTNSSKYVDIKIPNNSTGSPRNITFQYRRKNPDGTWQAWINIGNAISQPKGSVELSTGRVVALNDAPGTLYWWEAMGVSSAYRNEFYYTSYAGGNIDNSTYTPNVNTGCGSYSETGYPAGSWRLPTIDELLEISTYYTQIGNLKNPAWYWASTENSKSGAAAATMTGNSSGIRYNFYKYAESSPYYYARCVRAR